MEVCFCRRLPVGHSSGFAALLGLRYPPLGTGPPLSRQLMTNGMHTRRKSEENSVGLHVRKVLLLRIDWLIEFMLPGDNRGE